MGDPGLILAAAALEGGEEYVAGAYVVLVVLLVVYLGLMAAKLARISREIEGLADLAESRQGSAEPREEVRP